MHTPEAGSWKSAALQLRAANFLEGLSYVVLVFIAMPLKYLAGDPTLVQVFGRLHGGLFVLFVLALARCVLGEKWSLKRATVMFLASLVPLGSFFIERMITRGQTPKVATTTAD